MFYEANDKLSMKCGSCASICLIIGNRLYSANAGDCRAVICRNKEAIDLSLDQNLGREDEKQRVQDAGGLEAGKVLGRLQITRGFGDMDTKVVYKNSEQGNEEITELKYTTILVEPEVRIHHIDPFQDEFLVMGSDGLFE